jgi:hypothetical protein
MASVADGFKDDLEEIRKVRGVRLTDIKLLSGNLFRNPTLVLLASLC